MPKLVRLIEEIALFLRIVSMLLLLAVAQASDALLYLYIPQNHHRLSAQTLHIYAAAGPSERNSPRDIRLHQRVIRDGGSSLHRVEKVAVVSEHGEYNACSGGATIVAVVLLQIAGAQLRSACHVIL